MKTMLRAAASALVLTLGMSLGVAVAPSANATAIGREGCTPGYWKNHTENWQETTPGTKFGTLFTSARANVAGKTVLQALSGTGGTGVDGAALILARAAAAAWLNSAHEGLGYPWRRTGPGLDGRPALVSTVNAAFASGNRATMLDLASRLDRDNNLGCPLN